MEFKPSLSQSGFKAEEPTPALIQSLFDEAFEHHNTDNRPCRGLPMLLVANVESKKLYSEDPVPSATCALPGRIRILLEENEALNLRITALNRTIKKLRDEKRKK